MALTAQTVFDVDAGTQSITFSNPAPIDTITFSSNSITFSTEIAFSLAKSDFALYNQYLQAFNTLLILNFPKIPLSFNKPLPISLFAIYIPDLTSFQYLQTSNDLQVYQITYVPSATVDFLARDAVTITLQEFETCVLLFNQYANQVALN